MLLFLVIFFLLRCFEILKFHQNRSSQISIRYVHGGLSHETEMVENIKYLHHKSKPSETFIMRLERNFRMYFQENRCRFLIYLRFKNSSRIPEYLTTRLKIQTLTSPSYSTILWSTRLLENVKSVFIFTLWNFSAISIYWWNVAGWVVRGKKFPINLSPIDEFSRHKWPPCLDVGTVTVISQRSINQTAPPSKENYPKMTKKNGNKSLEIGNTEWYAVSMIETYSHLKQWHYSRMWIQLVFVICPWKHPESVS